MAARCFSLEARCKCYRNSSFASCFTGCDKRALTLWPFTVGHALHVFSVKRRERMQMKSGSAIVSHVQSGL